MKQMMPLSSAVKLRLSNIAYELRRLTLALVQVIDIPVLAYRYWRWERTRARNFVEAGKLYRTRRGTIMQVHLNKDGWFDGLPFAVTYPGEPKKKARYTVDHDGLLYPANLGGKGRYACPTSADIMPGAIED